MQTGAKNMQTGAKNMEKMCKKVQKPGTRKVSGERNRATCIHGALQGSTTLLVQPISNFVLLRAVPQCIVCMNQDQADQKQSTDANAL